MADGDPARLVFLDEAGIKTTLTRTYARAPVGVRAVGAAPAHWKRLTVLGALSLDGLAGTLTVPSGTTAVVFLDFLTTTVLPFLAEHKPDAILGLDKLSAHKNKAVQEVISAAGMTLQYLPRYSPDLSPIEACWSKIKTALRAQAARTVETLKDAFADAAVTITAQDTRAWFAHCGYPSPV
jgi:DDE superfamily endonuclease